MTPGSRMEIDRGLLLRVFTEECEEQLALVETGLIALETRPDDRGQLDAIFRAAHTLKGNASVVGFDAIVEVAHAVEALLEAWQKGRLAVRPGDVSLALRAVDLLRTVSAAALTGNESLPDGARALIAALEGASAGPPAAPAVAVAEAAVDGRAARTLRVDLTRLDRMVDLTGEITIAHNRMTQILSRGEGRTMADALEAHREIERLHMQLQELIMKARMVSIGPTFRQYVRTVRDLAISHGKLARLVTDGDSVELDNLIVERVRDALTHLVRNAIDHGIETPEVRTASGKDPRGTISLSAVHQAGNVIVRVADDGAGLSRGRIIEVAAARGREVPADLPDAEVYELIFEPGFSTAERVTDLSGRGVGLDAVRRSIDALRGSIAVESRPGEGTTFTLRLPLTVAIIDGFSVGVANETYVLPLDTVVECFGFDAEAAVRDGERGVVNLRGEALPYVSLRGLFDLHGSPASRENVVVVQHDGKRAGIAVDVLHGESQTVVKPLGPIFRSAPGVSGSAILGDGRVALILDVAGLLGEAHRRARRS